MYLKILSALLAFGFVVSPCAAAEPKVIRFSHVLGADTPKGRGAEKFRELTEKYAAGRLRVVVHHGGKFLNDRDEFEAMQVGNVEMLAPSLSKFGQLGVRQFELFDLPYLFPDRAAVFRAFDGPVGSQLFKRLERKGMLGLAYWDNAFKQMSANRVLKQPADVAGLKMRIQPSKVLAGQFAALGATPVAIPFNQAKAALGKGEVDGTENPLSTFQAQGFDTVQKNLTLTQHGYLGYAVVINREFWDGLPKDLQDVLRRAMQEATQYEREIAATDDAEALKKLEGRVALHKLTAAERDSWRKVLLPVQSQFAESVGQDLLEAARRVAQEKR